MKKRIQPRQTTALVLGLTAGVLLAACSPEPTPWVDEQYQGHAADIKKIFGNEVKEDSEQTYVASKVDWSTKGEGAEYGWDNKYELTLKTTKEKRKVGEEELPALNFYAKLPFSSLVQLIREPPAAGSFALSERTGDDVRVTRFKGNAQSERFKDGKLKVLEDGGLVLTYSISPLGENGYPTTWTFELKKKEN